MKEVMAVIRMDMINKTKDALLNSGFPSMNCRKVTGRGKKKVDFALIEQLIEDETRLESPKSKEFISEGHRLIPKRLLSLVVKEEEVQAVVDVIIKTNSKGNPGDGKIFVLPISDVVRVRTGETGLEAV